MAGKVIVVAVVGDAVTVATAMGLPNIPNSSDSWRVKILPAVKMPVVATVAETGDGSS